MSARLAEHHDERTRSAALLAAFVTPVVGLGALFMVCGATGMAPSIGLGAIALLVCFAITFALGYATFKPEPERTVSKVKVISVSDRFDAAA